MGELKELFAPIRQLKGWRIDALLPAELATKHDGPGPHEGTGTPQSVHGHGGDAKKPPKKVDFEFSDDLKADLDEIEFGDDTNDDLVMAIFDYYDVKPVDFYGESRADTYSNGELVIEWEKGSNTFSVSDVGDYVYEADIDGDMAKYEDHVNDEFWDSPGELYHATPSDNVASILKGKLKASSVTRGMSNRNEGDAVYTTASWDEASIGSYGDAILSIDTAAMKRDGLMPYVSLEPDIVEGEVRSSLASALGYDNFNYDYESGMSPNTFVIHGDIPGKYLKHANK